MACAQDTSLVYYNKLWAGLFQGASGPVVTLDKHDAVHIDTHHRMAIIKNICEAVCCIQSKR